MKLVCSKQKVCDEVELSSALDSAVLAGVDARLAVPLESGPVNAST